jgi:DNA-binding response OmpR family regulator
VLIVEDDPAARTAITRLLRRQGFAVSEASSVSEAISALSPPPAWILLDLMLPDGPGVDVIRKVKADQLPTRVCLVTGCSSELVNQARRAGAEHTFVKPLDVEGLMSVLAE